MSAHNGARERLRRSLGCRRQSWTPTGLDAIMRLVPMTPDYRSEKMDSAEGLGRAKARADAWVLSLPSDFRATFLEGGDRLEDVTARFPAGQREAVRKQLARGAKERSELIGFWVTWHFAGGFEALE